MVASSVKVVATPAEWPILVIEAGGTAVMAGFVYFACGRILSSFWTHLTTDLYINYIEIREDSIRFGIDGPQFEIRRQWFLVSKGLFGTNVVRQRYTERALVVATDAMPLTELKRLVEAK